LNGKEDIPIWAIIACAICYFLYFIFDILDGKHARNTGNSSPLGLLMDHGCDATTTFIFVMALASIIKLDSALYFVLIWLMISITFFTCTWEQLNTEIMEFPCINGINEGTIFVCGVEIFTSIVGQDFWLNKFNIFGTELRYNNFVVIMFFTFGQIFAIIK
jgi:ethanolaminephosphotransferase